METTEKIVEAYVRHIMGCATMCNVRCKGQYEIDLLAIHLVTGKRADRASGGGNFSRMSHLGYPPVDNSGSYAADPLAPSYGTSGYRVGRLAGLSLNSVSVAEYLYNGLSMTVLTDYADIDVQLDRTFSHEGKRNVFSYAGGHVWQRMPRRSRSHGRPHSYVVIRVPGTNTYLGKGVWTPRYDLWERLWKSVGELHRPLDFVIIVQRIEQRQREQVVRVKLLQLVGNDRAHRHHQQQQRLRVGVAFPFGIRHRIYGPQQRWRRLLVWKQRRFEFARRRRNGFGLSGDQAASCSPHGRDDSV